MIRVLTILIATLSLSAGAADYRGKVGKLEAAFSLEWGDDGSVRGSYQYDNRPGAIYGLDGSNPAEGELYLEEFTGNQLTARCHLKKVVTNGSIVWRGEMHNLDGRVFPMEFARDREKAPATPSATSGEETRYKGYVGKMDAEFSLHWNQDRSVQGSYHYPDRPGTTYRLSGSNPREGELFLEEYTGRELTARCVLQKRVEADVIVWEGVMLNLDGRRFPMAFSRVRDGQIAPVIDDYEARRAAVFQALETEVNWDQFPMADAPVEMVPIHLEQGEFFAGKLIEVQSGEGRSVLRFRVGEWDDKGKLRQEVTRDLTLRMGRELPVRPKLLTGREFALLFDPDGRLFSVELLEAAITHVRRTPSGKLEVRALIDLFDPEVDTEWDPAAFAEKMKKAPVAEFLPDKLALDLSFIEDPTIPEELWFQTIRLVRDYGVSIQATAAGAGMLELETVSLDPGAEAEPWISLKGLKEPVKAPPSQFTNQAG